MRQLGIEPSLSTMSRWRGSRLALVAFGADAAVDVKKLMPRQSPALCTPIPSAAYELKTLKSPIPII